MIVGTGVDVIEIARIERVLAERGERFERRVFTPREIETCRKLGRPAAPFALRFAIKEAAMKALGTGWAAGVRWLDIETLAPSGAPRESAPRRLCLKLCGRAGEVAAERAGRPSYRVHVAGSCSRTHALALVLLEVLEP